MKKLVLFILTTLVFAQAPEDPGLYAVGCRLDTLIRPSSTDTSHRVMVVYTWYPAREGTGIWLYPVQAWWHAQPAAADSPRPAVVFSHGGCGHPLASVFFTSHLASWGFIVIATAHPGSMWGDEDCFDSAAIHDTWLNRPDDVQFTVDSMIALSMANPSLFGRIDTSKMAMIGHSFGARTTYAVCNRQNWVKCAVALSGDYDDIFGAPINCMDDIRGIDVPIMLMCGSRDLGLESAHMAQIFDSISAPKVAVEIFGAVHLSFSDSCDPTIDPLCGTEGTLDQDLAHTIINHYATAFLLKYLAGADSLDDLICSNYDTLTTVWCDLAGVKEQTSFPPSADLRCFPVPFTQVCNIEIGEPNCPPRLEIVDISGRVVFSRVLQPGEKSVRWRPVGCPPGVYFVRGGNGEIFGKILYLR